MTEVWRLQGTNTQNEIVRDALEHTTFPFEVLKVGLSARVNRDYIPVEWADLSRYTARLAEVERSGDHLHVHENNDTAHPVERRERVLGLAWYSGKVTLEQSMESDPELAAEVFLSEGAHMLDFFWMTDRHRTAIWNALHPDEQDLHADTDIEDEVDHGHGHSWFDVGDYRSWVGEAWMGLFVRAYSDFAVTIDFDHPPSETAVAETRAALTPYWGLEHSTVYHDSHRMPLSSTADRYFIDPPTDRQACRVCDPK